VSFYGLLTVARHKDLYDTEKIFLRVYVDDVDITDRCLSADDRHGWALVFDYDRQGRVRVDVNRKRIAARVVIGDVEIQPGLPFHPSARGEQRDVEHHYIQKAQAVRAAS